MLFGIIPQSAGVLLFMNFIYYRTKVLFHFNISHILTRKFDTLKQNESIIVALVLRMTEDIYMKCHHFLCIRYLRLQFISYNIKHNCSILIKNCQLAKLMDLIYKYQDQKWPF